MREHINEALRRRVRLETLYPYQVKPGLNSGGKPCSGYFDRRTGDIFLNAYLEEIPNSLVAVYLHEVGHLIAEKFGLDESPDASAHNQYFAVLVAIMYRRANLLDKLKIYDFCDTEQGQRFYFRDAPMLPDEDLIKRFRYVLRRSAALAKTRLSIEQIADLLHDEDAIRHWQTGEFTVPIAKPIRWVDIGLGALLGASFTVATTVTAASLLIK